MNASATNCWNPILPKRLERIPMLPTSLKGVNPRPEYLPFGHFWSNPAFRLQSDIRDPRDSRMGLLHRPENNRRIIKLMGDVKKSFPDPLVRQRLFPDPTQIFLFAPTPLEDAPEDGIVVIDTNVLLVPYMTGRA